MTVERVLNGVANVFPILLAIALLAIMIAVVVDSERNNKACFDRGGVPLRGVCLDKSLTR